MYRFNDNSAILPDIAALILISSYHNLCYSICFIFSLVCPADARPGYKKNKARKDEARKDGALLWHWQRQADQGKEYPFAQIRWAISVFLLLKRCL